MTNGDGKGKRISGQHYFTPSPVAPHTVRTVTAAVRGVRVNFLTDRAVFSRGGLDRGTRILIENLDVPDQGRLLDWGCGYGPIGLIWATLKPRLEVWMVDINERAVALARQNARLNGLTNVRIVQSDGISALPADLTFHIVVSNPPIRAGKKVLRRLIDEAFRVLEPSGSLWLVAPTWLGARSLLKMVAERFGNARWVVRKGGYRVICSQKVSGGPSRPGEERSWLPSECGVRGPENGHSKFAEYQTNKEGRRSVKDGDAEVAQE